jgi:hypothetical protein
MMNRWLRGYRSLIVPKAAGGGGGGGAPDPHADTHLSTGSDPIDAATTAIAGLLSAADKTKINYYSGVTLGVAGNTTAQATATALTTQFNVVSAGAQFDAVKLPASWQIGTPVFVFNRLGTRSTTFNFVRVFPQSGEAITNLAADAAHFLPCEMVGVYTKVSATQWHAVVLPMPTGANGFAFTDEAYFYRAPQFLSGIAVSNASITTSDGRLTFSAATGNNRILFPDNLAEAFWLGEGTTRYISFVSTNSAEEILFNSKPISGYRCRINEQTGTSYAVVSGDSGKVVECNNAAAFTLTLPATGAVGDCVTIVQKGAGQVTVQSAGSGSVVNVDGHTKTKGQYAVCTAYVTSNAGGSAAVWLFAGNTAA